MIYSYLQKNSKVLYFYFALCNIGNIVSSYEDVFEFGDVNVGGEVIFNGGASIPDDYYHKLTFVAFPVPHKMEIAYIRVAVTNHHAPPVVSYDRDISTIIIRYRAKQKSDSTYSIIVRAVPIVEDYSEEYYDGNNENYAEEYAGDEYADEEYADEDNADEDNADEA